MDFKSINFTSDGIAESSPLNRQRPESGFQFDFNTDRNAIGKSKIKNFNFSSGSGGTLTLGGTANGNGVMLVKDASGSTQVTVNNTGIIVNNGSITLKNTAGSTTFDNAGLVSLSNFITTSATKTGGLNQSISGTSSTTLTDSEMTFVLSRTTLMLFQANVSCYIYGGTSDTVLFGQVGMMLGTTPFEDFVIGNDYHTVFSTSMHRIMSVAAGTHTFKLTGNLVNPSGTPSMTIYKYRESYVALGT